MLEIRSEQMTAFEQAALIAFEDEMVEHLKNFSPQHCEVMGESRVRSVIQLGMARARTYGFTNRGPARFYLEMMFMFGTDFDSDPLLPWVLTILNDPATPDQMVRADRLYEGLMDYAEKVAGPNNQYIKEALRRASVQRFEDL